MIFASGFALWMIALLLSRGGMSSKPGSVVSWIALAALLLMLTSVCLLIARYMP